MKGQGSLRLAGLVLFLAGTLFLIYRGIQKGEAHHLSVAHALALPEDNSRALRVFGRISEQALVSKNGFSVFFLEDRDSPALVMKVAYAGAIPEGFKAGIEIYAEGCRKNNIAGEKAFLQATNLIATCPSKYTQ